MFSLIVAAIAALAIGGFIWVHDSSVAKEARDKQYAADQKVEQQLKSDIGVCVKENAQAKLTNDMLRDQVNEQNLAVAAMDRATLAMRQQRVKEAVKAQDKVIKLDAEMIDLDVALRQRNDQMTCDPRIVAMLRAALAQQRRDHPGNGKVLEPGAPVVIKP